MIRRLPRRGFVPRLHRLEERRLLASSAAYMGLSSLDVAGPTAAIGPGGDKNLHVQLSIPLDGLGRAATPQYVNISGPTGFQWTYGTTGPGSYNPQANPVIAIPLGTSSSDGKSELYDAYFSPVVSAVDSTTGATTSKTLANNQALSITVAYNYFKNGPLTTDTPTSDPALVVTPTDLNQSLTDATPTLPNVMIGTYAGSFTSQSTDGNAHIQISGLPAGAQINQGTAELSDIAGLYWNWGITYGRGELGMTITEPSSGGTTADIAFPPERDEAGTTMTFRFQLNNSPNWYVTDVALGASQHTDPNQRSTGPINPSTTALVVSPTSTTNLVAYTNSSGQQQTIDFQQLLNSGHQVTTLSDGTYNLSEVLTINSGLILQGADSNVELNFVGLPTITQGVINFGSSHITLKQFKIRFQDSSVNFTGGTTAAIISDDEQGGQTSRVDLNIENLDIQAPANSSAFLQDGVPLAIPTTYMDNFDSGTIQNNVISGGPIQVQWGPWQISGNHVTGAVKGALNTEAFGVYAGHDISLSSNVVTDTDSTNHGAIDRFFTADKSGYNFNLVGNTVSNNVGLIAPVPNGSPAPGTPENPRNEPEEVLFEDYSKIFEGSVTAIGVSSSSSAGDNRRVISIPTKEFDLFSGYSSTTNGLIEPLTGSWALTVLDGSTTGQHIRVIEAFPSATDPNNTDFLLNAPLPAGTYDLDIEPAYVNVNITGQNSIDTSGTVSTALVFASTMVDANVSGNTFTGDQSSLVDGNQHTLQSQAIRVDPNKANLSSNYLHSPFGKDYDSYNEVQVNISGNIFVNPIGGVKAYIEADNSLSTTTGRTYGIVTLTNNQFQYSYSNPSIISLGRSGDYSTLINNTGVVYYQYATNFTDPNTISLTASGNTVQWTNGATAPATDVVVNAADVNGTLYEANATPPILTDVSSLATVQVPLGSYFNTVGITNDNNTAASSGGFDGGGNSYSAAALGVTNGTIAWNGYDFNIGAAGANDVVSLGGTRITVPNGQYTSLLVLGASTNKDRLETFTIYYTDGSTATVNHAFSDWSGSTSNGAGNTYPDESLVATASYYNSATGGRQTAKRYLYGYKIPLDPTKTVSGIGTVNDNNIKLLAIDLL